MLCVILLFFCLSFSKNADILKLDNIYERKNEKMNLICIEFFIEELINNLKLWWSVLAVLLSASIALYILNKEIEHHYKFKILELIEEILNNFRVQPTISIFQPWQIDKRLSILSKKTSYEISSIVAKCSMGAPMPLNILIEKKKDIKETLPDWKKGLIVLWGISMVSIKDPSIKKNWVNGKIIYNPDIRRMRKDKLIDWINEYQKVMSGLEFAWSNNKKNVLSFIKDSDSYIKAQGSVIFYTPDIDYDNIEKDLSEYFKFVYKNLAICEKLNFLLKRIDKLN